MQYLAVILGVFGLELKIKNEIEEKLTEGSEKSACGGLLLIRRHHNRGAFLNAGQSKQKVIAGISVLLTVLAIQVSEKLKILINKPLAVP
jgi:signal peptidase II